VPYDKLKKTCQGDVTDFISKNGEQTQSWVTCVNDLWGIIKEIVKCNEAQDFTDVIQKIECYKQELLFLLIGLRSTIMDSEEFDVQQKKFFVITSTWKTLKEIWGEGDEDSFVSNVSNIF
jgi:hypothetical protein